MIASSIESSEVFHSWLFSIDLLSCSLCLASLDVSEAKQWSNSESVSRGVFLAFQKLRPVFREQPFQLLVCHHSTSFVFQLLQSDKRDHFLSGR